MGFHLNRGQREHLCTQIHTNLGCDGPAFRLDEYRRFLIHSDPDAFYRRLCGITRDDFDYLPRAPDASDCDEQGCMRTPVRIPGKGMGAASRKPAVANNFGVFGIGDDPAVIVSGTKQPLAPGQLYTYRFGRNFAAPKTIGKERNDRHGAQQSLGIGPDADALKKSERRSSYRVLVASRQREAGVMQWKIPSRFETAAPVSSMSATPGSVGQRP